MTDQPRKLYGLGGAEVMYSTVAGVYEHEIEGVYPDDGTVIIEEWSVADNLKFMPSPDKILTDLLEYTVDQPIAEGWYESAEKGWTLKDPEVLGTVHRLCRVLADKVTFSMADQQLRTLTLEVNGGHPKIEGEALYVRSPELLESGDGALPFIPKGNGDNPSE